MSDRIAQMAAVQRAAEAQEDDAVWQATLYIVAIGLVALAALWVWL